MNDRPVDGPLQINVQSQGNFEPHISSINLTYTIE